MPLRASRTLHVEPRLPAALEPLRTISRNLWWSWNTDASALFQRLGPQRWAESEHNPVRLLQSVPFEELEEAAADPGFISHLGRVHDDFEAYLERPPVPTAAGAAGPIAYFSLEFALTESLPNYSGGLGVLAGDHLKSASDAGLPLVAVGLLYSEGYFKQVLGPDGWQSEEYQEIDFFAQPLQPVLTEAGSGLEVSVPMEGRTVSLRVLRLDVGRVPLFLLDANIPANSAADRPITARLYGGELEMRMQQEMALGIGGIRALEAMGIHPSVCHMNEGHSALLGLERIRTLMSEAGASFDEAAIPVTAGTVFTTHTPVAAGIDLFPPELVQRYLGHFAETLGLDSRRFMAMGRMNPDDALEPFSMALLGLRLSGYRNGVSKVHAVVARRLWENAWRGLPAEHVPIASITNGVHLPTWVSHDMGDLFDRYIGRQWRETPEHKELWERLENVPDEELWETHESQRRSLVSRARLQHRDSNARRGLAGTEPGGERILDPGVLTIGFARRFAGYKRATLLFRDPARLAQILNHPERPVQLIVAGKAHPRDEQGKQLIREVVEFSREPQFRDRLVVLENPDVEMARGLVQGCDVWLNTPLRPLEASG
ncbi:MAG: alpha-glucan family phosphorylase, partial [Tepidiformaceae bacterium]